MKLRKTVLRHHLRNELYSGFWSHGHPYLLKLLSNHSIHADLILMLVAQKTMLFIVKESQPFLVGREMLKSQMEVLKDLEDETNPFLSSISVTDFDIEEA